MFDPSFILAILAVPVFAMATIINLRQTWLNRYDNFGTWSIPLLTGGLSAWYAAGYIVLIINVFPELETPINVAVLRPATLITGILFTLIPGYITSMREILGLEECRRELQALNARLKEIDTAKDLFRDLNLIYKSRIDELENELKKHGKQR